MNSLTRLTLACGTFSLFSAQLSQAQNQDIKHFTGAKISPVEFAAKLQKENSPLPGGGQLQMSYANVVDKILPSVVTVFSFGENNSQRQLRQLEDILPRDHPLFYFFGAPEEEEGGRPNRRRGQQQQRPDESEEEAQNDGSPKEKYQQNGVGSGFIISPDGYILTNNHVVADADKLEVLVTRDGSTKRYQAEVMGTDPQTDVALIKIDAQDLPPATLADSSQLRVGDIVLAAGAPMELSRSVSQGIISALGRSIGIIGSTARSTKQTQGYEDFIQTDAAINPGNSGGPLVDATGRVIGINTAIFSRSGMSSGIGFAIPINLALRIAEDLIDDGEVSRGYLGILPQDLDSETVKLWQLSDETGAMVKKVVGGSPADKAGVEVGDVILRVSGQRIEKAARLPVIVSTLKPGTPIQLEIIREGKLMSLTAVLAKRDDKNAAGVPADESPKLKATPGSQSVAELLPGLVIQNLTPSMRQRYEIEENVQGIVITQVDKQSNAAASGVEEGDVILQVNRQPVRAVSEAEQMVKDGSSSKTILKIYRKGDRMQMLINNG
jgi:Do/DeqQ family serine protease